MVVKPRIYLESTLLSYRQVVIFKSNFGHHVTLWSGILFSVEMTEFLSS